jgi:phosphate transport system substrate-binding protein
MGNSKKTETNKNFTTGLSVILIVLSVMLALPGCGISGNGGNGENSGSSNNGGSSGSKGDHSTVVIAGSTSVQPLSEALADAFTEENEDISIEVQGGGSGQGIKAIRSGIADLGALSREVSDDEKASISDTYVIANDGIAVIVNPKSKVKDLTIAQIKAIFTGKITNWKEIDGTDLPVTVISREAGSGTRTAFTEITGVLVKDANGDERDDTALSSVIQGSNGAVLQTVAETEGTIGYISLGALTGRVKVLAVEGTEASEQTVLNGEYPIARPFIYVSGGGLSSAAQKWIDFVLSDEGQDIVEESGFIPVD